jgi:hypothetical protein
MGVLRTSFLSSTQPGKQNENENETGRESLLQTQLSKYPHKEQATPSPTPKKPHDK